MNTCKECGKGYCPNRVKRVFGKLPNGICSPQCYTLRVTKREAAKILAGQIFDALYESGFIDDAIAIRPEKFAEGVKIISPLVEKN